MEAYDWRCMNCGGFHGYGNCPYYDQEDFDPWHPPIHQYYGEYEQEPLEKEESHQGQGSGKKSLEDLLESFVIESEKSYRRQEASIKNLQIQMQKFSRLIMEESQVSFPSDIVINPVENCGELQIEENLFPQAFEEEEEDQGSLKQVSSDDHELECRNTMGEQKEEVVKCEDLKEIPIVDFVFGDKLRIDEEKPLSINIYLMNSWSKGVQGKEQPRGGDVLSTTWNRISENFLKPLVLYLITVAMLYENSCNTMMELSENLHDLKDLLQFAINPG